MSHLEAFKQFVASQEPERKVNHGSGWDACAIGEYAESVNVNPLRVADSLAFESPQIYECLNQGGRGHMVQGVWFDSVNIKTYGKLSEYIQGVTPQ